MASGVLAQVTPGAPLISDRPVFVPRPVEIPGTKLVGYDLGQMKDLLKLDAEHQFLLLKVDALEKEKALLEQNSSLLQQMLKADDLRFDALRERFEIKIDEMNTVIAEKNKAKFHRNPFSLTARPLSLGAMLVLGGFLALR